MHYKLEEIEQLYFSWLVNKVSEGCPGNIEDYSELMNLLYSTEFYWRIPMDVNRAKNGEYLRQEFSADTKINIFDVARAINKPCSVLEMLVGLSVACEDQIMHDPDLGDRTGNWFWLMLTNLDLHTFMNESFNAEEAEEILETFMDRTYSPDGQGGLFYIQDCKYDLTKVEIWYQMMWYLDEVLGL